MCNVILSGAMSTDPDKSVLFVCLGNICRSPIAEAVFLHLLEERNLKGKWKVEKWKKYDEMQSLTEFFSISRSNLPLSVPGTLASSLTAGPGRS